MPSNQRLPLSAAQYGIWLGQQLHPNSHAYWAAEAIELNGELDLAAFSQLLEHELKITESLQMVYGASGAEPWQSANPTARPWLQRIDFSLQADPWLAAQNWMRQDLQRRRGLASANDKPQPVFATALLQLGPRRQLWYLCVHHIALDGFGFALFSQRLATAYAAWSQGIVLRRPADVDLAQVIAEDQSYQATRAESDRAFWLQRLATAPAAFTLAPPRDFCDHSLKHRIKLPRTSLDRWQQAAQACAVDWSIWLLAAISAWVQQHSGVSGFRLGLPVMGRLGSVALDIPCMLMNIVPLVVEIEANASMASLCQQLAAELRRIRPHQRYRYEHLKQDLKLAGEQRLFGPVVNIMPFEHFSTFGPLSARFHPITAGPVEDLAISIMPLPDGLQLSLEANPASYSAEQLAQYQSDLLQVLDCLLATEHQPLCQRLAAIPSPPKVDSRLRGEPLTQAPSPILELFLNHTRTRPQHPALEHEGEIRTYAELLTDVQQLAGQLRFHGVGPNSRVVLLLPRQSQTITAILAILWAGGAYVPLDPDGPTARINRVLADVQPTLVLSHNRYAQQHSQELPAQLALLCLDQLAATLVDALPQPVAVDPSALAYFIYTSGTTGKPNGVMVSCQALAHFVASASQRYGMSADDRSLQFAPLHFDASVEEIFLTLCAGATLVLRNQAMLESMPQFLTTLARWRISVLDLPTAFWHELSFAIGQGQESLPDSIRLVIIGGEAALAERVARWRTSVSAQVLLLNTYGPTEATVICSTAVLSGPAAGSTEETVPIGRPLPGVDLIVVDAQLRPCPPGQEGELCIIGPTLAQGYWDRATTTAQRFITLHALADAPRAYRSGDRVVLAADGQLRYLGRLDDEFKLSGHRIDPAEVETALLAYPGIREAAVLGLSLAQGFKQLVAFVVLGETSHWDNAPLRRHLLERLAAPAVPSRYVLLAQLPRNANGKIDRSVLRQHPDLNSTAPVAAATPMESTVMAVWQEVLGLAQIRPEDDFFASGGKSLQAIQVANRLGLALQREVAVSALFRHRTVADLAQALSAPTRHHPPSAIPDPLAPCLLLQRGEGRPLFCIHPAEGLSWCYLGLAASLPELSLYGLQASGLSGQPSESFDSMIDDYLSRIREQQNQGPYRLLGWSSGGGIAHALACALQTQGEQVELLAMMDAYPADIWADKPVATRRDALVNLLDVIGASEYDADGRALNEAELIALLSRPGSVLAAYHIGQLTEVSLHNMQLYRQAQHPHFQGDLLFFHATQRRAQAPDWRLWQTYVSGQIQITDINSSHTGMSLPQPLAAIGRVLADQLLPQTLTTGAR